MANRRKRARMSSLPLNLVLWMAARPLGVIDHWSRVRQSHSVRVKVLGVVGVEGAGRHPEMISASPE